MRCPRARAERLASSTAYGRISGRAGLRCLASRRRIELPEMDDLTGPQRNSGVADERVGARGPQFEPAECSSLDRIACRYREGLFV